MSNENTTDKWLLTVGERFREFPCEGDDRLLAVEAARNGKVEFRGLLPAGAAARAVAAAEAGTRPDLPSRVSFFLVREEAVGELERFGGFTMNHWLRGLHGLDPELGIRTMVSEDPLTDMADERFIPVEFILNPKFRQLWKTADGRLHVEPFPLTEWVLTELNDGFYDLDSFAEELSKRDDVAFLTNTHRFADGKPGILAAPLTGNEDELGGIISDIEHHIEDGESAPAETEQLSLLFYPEPGRIAELAFWDSGKQGREPENYAKGIFFVERHIIRDILGGEKFMLRPYAETAEPKRKFKR